MKKESVVFASLIALGLVLAGSCFAGVESSGGVEAYTPGPAWFMSLDANAKIRTCTLVSSDFGVDRSVAEATLQSAFKKWGDYMVDKLIQVLPKKRMDDDYIFITALQMLPSCDGTEDLRVYFGAKDEQVQAARARYVKPFGFIQRQSDPELAWGKGFMYIATPSEIDPAPAWTTEDHLIGILLHEVGHILGNSHLDGTIMDSQLGKFLRYIMPGGDPHLRNIDGDRELFVCVRCGIVYESVKDFGDYSPAAAFRTITGKEAQGISSARFVKMDKQDRDGEPRRKDYNLPEGELIITDQAGDHAFHVKSESLISLNEIEVLLFQEGSPSLGRSSSRRSRSRTFLGSLERSDGTLLPVVINLNANGYAFEIQLADGNRYPPQLFVSSWVNN